MLAFAQPSVQAQADDSVCGRFEFIPDNLATPAEGTGGGSAGFCNFIIAEGTDQYEVWEVHPLANAWDFPPLDRYVRIWEPDVTPADGSFPPMLLGWASYEVVDSCSPPADRTLIDDGRYVADVTIPDGTTFAPNAKFTKTWRVQNSGNVAWSTAYQLVFVSGERMGSPAAVNLSRAVKPGEQMDLSVQLSAPAKPGKYHGTYQLRNAQGTFFGSKLTVVIKVLAPTATRTPVAKRSPTVTPTPTPQTFTVTWMEIAPQVPVQNQTAVVQVFFDNAGARDANYLTDFDGEIILRNSVGQVVERQAFDHDHNASLLPDAEALKKDLLSKKLVLTVRQVRFKQWADTATLEVWLRPLGARSGTNAVKASMQLAVKADPDALTRCVSFVSKKLSAWPIGDVKWVLVGTGAATRIGTCTTRECVALEIAQLAVKLGKAEAMQLLSVALQVVNLQNMTGAADCYNLFAP